MSYTIEQIRKVTDARPWTPSYGGPARYYVNNWPELAGLDIYYYNTGNVSYARLDGEKISNTQARRYLGDTKVWFDADGKLWFRGLHEDLKPRLVATVREMTAVTATTAEAAERLGVSVRTIQRRAQRGTIAATKTGGRWVITL